MAVISLATTKGGAGKTTTAIALATQLSKRGIGVTLMDCDPEQWAFSWGKSARENGWLPSKLQVVAAPKDDDLLLDAIEQAEQQSTLVILDLEGSGNAAVGYAIARSDLVIIPMRASGMDGRAALKTVRLVMTQKKLLKREIPIAVLFTCTSAVIRYKLQTNLSANLTRAGIRVFETELVDRVAFKEMLNRSAPLEHLGKDVSGVKNAIENAAALTGEAITILQEGQSEAEQTEVSAA